MCQCMAVCVCMFVYVCLPVFVRVCLHLACLLSSLGSSNLAIIQLKLPALTTSLHAPAPCTLLPPPSHSLACLATLFGYF